MILSSIIGVTSSRGTVEDTVAAFEAAPGEARRRVREVLVPPAR